MGAEERRREADWARLEVALAEDVCVWVPGEEEVAAA